MSELENVLEGPDAQPSTPRTSTMLPSPSKNKKMNLVDMLEEVFGSAEAAGTALEIGAVDLVEMFSPQMTKELERFGLAVYL